MRTSRIEMNAIAGVVILFGSLTVAVAELRPTPDGDCADLRGENGAISCSYKAYETWLDAGRENFKLDSVCHNDLVELTQRCNTANFLDGRLDDAENIGMAHSKRLLTNLFEFLNHNLISLCRETHPDALKLHLDDNRDRGSYQDWLGHSIEDATNRLLEAKCVEGRRLRSENARRKDIELAVYQCMTTFILKPCGRYLHLMDDLIFGPLKRIVSITMDNDWDFLENQSEKFKDAVFRYQFCTSIGARKFDEDYKGVELQDFSSDFKADQEDFKTLKNMMQDREFLDRVAEYVKEENIIM